MKRIFFGLAISIILITLLLSACSGGGGSSSNSGTSGSTYAITGRVMVDAPVSGATVNLYSLNSNGTAGALLGTAVTGTTGNFSVTLQSVPTSPVLARASAGSYHDTVSGGVEILSSSDILQAVLSSGTTTAAITPLTNMAAARASAVAGAGTALAAAVSLANTGVAQQYNLPDILSTIPPDPNDPAQTALATRDEIAYLLVLEGIAEEANALNVRTIVLAAALAADMSDGTLDGSNGSSVQLVTKASTTINLSPSAGVSGVQTGIDNFMSSPANLTNITAFTIIPTPEVIPVAPANFVAIATLPAWIEGTSGTATIPGLNGNSTSLCSLTSGSLPAWLAINNCTLGGMAPLLPAGTSSSISAPFTITVSDPSNPQSTHDITLMITVVEQPPVIVPSSAICMVNQPCTSVVASVTGGTAPYSYLQGSFANGTLPLGMSVQLFGLSNSAVIQGTPTLPGTYPFQVCVVDLAHFEACTMTSVEVESQCTYSISPTSQSFSSSGGNDSVAVTASSGCSWTAASNAGWITISSGSSGSGNGTVGYSVAANTGTGQRTGTITVAGKTFTVTQAGAAANVTGTWTGTLNMPGAAYTGCDAQTISFSLSLDEDASMNITGSTSNGRTIASGNRSGTAITVTLNTMYGSRGPYTWTWDGANTITGSMAYFCYDLATNALQSEGIETFTVTR